jgi:ATP-dependent Clp protease ATP-binding subunit ClpB
MYIAPEVEETFTSAEQAAERLKDEYISAEHLLLGLVASTKSPALSNLFKSFSITRDKILGALKDVRGNQRVTSQTPEDTYQALEKYGTDLVTQARRGKLDPVIGRDGEIRRVIRILSRKTKNNPVLIGEPGVARRPLSRVLRSGSSAATCPRPQGPHDLLARLGSLLAGAKYRASSRNASRPSLRR